MRNTAYILLKPCAAFVALLASKKYKDSDGQALVESSEFLELEQMASEPPLPDPTTQTVAGIVHYLEACGYTNVQGEPLARHPLIGVLKLINVRKGFRDKPEEVLRLLGFLEDGGFKTDPKNLRDDDAFRDLRRIVISEGLARPGT